MPAPRGMIFDRNDKILAENVPGYSVQLLSGSADSLRATLTRLAAIVPLTRTRSSSRCGATPRARAARRSSSPTRRSRWSRCSKSGASSSRARDPSPRPSDSIPRARRCRRCSASGRSHRERTHLAAVQGLQDRPAGWEDGAREAVRGPAARAGGIAFVEVDARGRVVREAVRARTPARSRSAAAHQHRSRSAEVRRGPLRRLAAGRRDRARPGDGRRARAVLGAELRHESVHWRHAAGTVEGAQHGSAPPALQQGDPGAIYARLHVEAGDGGGRRCRKGSRRWTTTCREPCTGGY